VGLVIAVEEQEEVAQAKLEVMPVLNTVGLEEEEATKRQEALAIHTLIFIMAQLTRARLAH